MTARRLRRGRRFRLPLLLPRPALHLAGRAGGGVRRLPGAGALAADGAGRGRLPRGDGGRRLADRGHHQPLRGAGRAVGLRRGGVVAAGAARLAARDLALSAGRRRQPRPDRLSRRRDDLRSLSREVARRDRGHLRDAAAPGPPACSTPATRRGTRRGARWEPRSPSRRTGARPTAATASPSPWSTASTAARPGPPPPARARRPRRPGPSPCKAPSRRSPTSRHLQMRVSWSSVSDWAPVLVDVWAEYETLDNAPNRRRWELVDRRRRPPPAPRRPARSPDRPPEDRRALGRLGGAHDADVQGHRQRRRPGRLQRAHRGDRGDRRQAERRRPLGREPGRADAGRGVRCGDEAWMGRSGKTERLPQSAVQHGEVVAGEAPQAAVNDRGLHGRDLGLYQGWPQ